MTTPFILVALLALAFFRALSAASLRVLRRCRCGEFRRRAPLRRGRRKRFDCIALLLSVLPLPLFSLSRRGGRIRGGVARRNVRLLECLTRLLVSLVRTFVPAPAALGRFAR